MGLEKRKEQLRRDIERKARYLETLENMPDFDMFEDGTVLGLAVSYSRGMTHPMIAYKAGDSWWVTGAALNGVSSNALTEWLVSQGRYLLSAQVLAEFRVEPVQAFDLGAALGDLMDSLSGRNRYVGASDYDEASGRGV